MIKTIYQKFDKQQMSELPLVSFSGKIYVISTEKEAEVAVDYLLSNDVLGIDTETRPSFRKGILHKVSLLQVATREACFLFRLNKIGLTDGIKRILENKKVPMIGLSLHDDLSALQRRGAFTPGLFIDLQTLVKEIGVEDMSLQKLYANLFHEKISKRQRMSNWDAEVLEERQKQYAAIDAWACIRLYDEILRLRKSRDYNLIAAVEDKDDNEISCT